MLCLGSNMGRGIIGGARPCLSPASTPPPSCPLLQAELRLKNDEVLALSVELASAKRQLEVATQIRSKTGNQEQAGGEQQNQEELIGVFRH